MVTSLLSVEDLHVHRGDAHVLHGISFSVSRNQVTALLGRNGAGKTTTLLALLGLLPGQGSVRLDGEELLGEPTHEIVGRGIGYVPEDREVFSNLTVEENLRLATRPDTDADRGRERRALVDELFPILADRRSQAAGTLSGGQQQMLAIARALLNDNQLLLVDEPSKGLAPSVIADMVDALGRATAHTTVLLVEQNLRVAERLATDAVVLDQGRIVFDGTMQQLFGDPELTHTHLGVSRGPNHQHRDGDPAPGPTAPATTVDRGGAP